MLDYMDQFHSKRTPKVVTEKELQDKKDKSEITHQLKICKWIKEKYPKIIFRSDMQAGRKKSRNQINMTNILDPFSGWPDIAVYHRSGNYCGLQIELKRLDSGTFLKDGSLSSGKHVQEQNEMHIFLRSLGYKVEFAEGFDEAKRIFESYINNH